jgi:hypothetical protein
MSPALEKRASLQCTEDRGRLRGNTPPVRLNVPKLHTAAKLGGPGALPLRGSLTPLDPLFRGSPPDPRPEGIGYADALGPEPVADDPHNYS